jgi:undecaprenyl-diphosphatase
MDQQLLLWINQGWSSTPLDYFFIWLSSRAGFSFPLLAGFLIWWGYRHGRDGLKFWGLLILVIALGDQLGGLLKDLLAQHRPCYDIASLVRRPGHDPGSACGDSLTGMPSNHALNFFAVAAFLGLALRSVRLGAAMFGVAFLVALSRVYLAKHYPSQVLVGGAVGVAWGVLCAVAARQWLPVVGRMVRGERTEGLKD